MPSPTILALEDKFWLESLPQASRKAVLRQRRTSQQALEKAKREVLRHMTILGMIRDADIRYDSQKRKMTWVPIYIPD